MKKEVYEAPVLEIIEVNATIDTLGESNYNSVDNPTATTGIESFTFGE